MYYRSLMVKLESSSFVGGWLKVGCLTFESRSRIQLLRLSRLGKVDSFFNSYTF